MMQRVVLKMRHTLSLDDMCDIEDRLDMIGVTVDWDCVSVEMDAVYVEADVDDELIRDYGMLRAELFMEFDCDPEGPEVEADDDRTRKLQEELA